MIEELLKKHVKEQNKLPVAHCVWQVTRSNYVRKVEIISILHNTSMYNLNSLYKPISKTIEFTQK